MNRLMVLPSWVVAILFHLLIIAFILPWHHEEIYSLPNNLVLPSAYVQINSNKESLSSKGEVKKIAINQNSQSQSLATTQLTKQLPVSENMAALLNLVEQNIAAHLVYPNEIHSDATVWLQFELEPNGQIEKINLQQSSGLQVFDQEALSAVQLSSPINLPIKLSSAIQLSLPVHFISIE